MLVIQSGITEQRQVANESGELPADCLAITPSLVSDWTLWKRVSKQTLRSTPDGDREVVVEEDSLSVLLWGVEVYYYMRCDVKGRGYWSASFHSFLLRSALLPAIETLRRRFSCRGWKSIRFIQSRLRAESKSFCFNIIPFPAFLFKKQI